MRVGVYAGDFPPTVGGGHGFVATVLDAFLEHARASRHEFIVLCEPAQEQALAPRCAAAGIPMHTLGSRSLFGAGVAVLKNYAPLAYLLRHWPGRLEAAARRRGIEFVWFVPGIAYEALDIPYLGTIWDLQHRMNPWFPELAADGMWEHRELVYSRFVRRAAHLLTGSRVNAEQLTFLFQIPPERLSVVRPPVPKASGMAADGPPAAFPTLAGSRFFLYPAQFWAHKNHVNLIHAFARMDGELRLVLPGSDKGNLAHARKVATGLGLEGRVFFPGFVSSAELAWLYRNALAMVYPSFNGPINMPALEAFSLGCPVAVADYPGAEEQTGDAALRFDPRSPEQIAQTLSRLAGDSGLRNELARRGRERAALWGGGDYVRAVFAILDGFENTRRCWT